MGQKVVPELDVADQDGYLLPFFTDRDPAAGFSLVSDGQYGGVMEANPARPRQFVLMTQQISAASSPTTLYQVKP